MLTYKRIYMDDEVMRYAFYPDGNLDAEGIVEFKKGEGAKILKHSPEDFKMRYGLHAFHIDLTTESGTIAWY